MVLFKWVKDCRLGRIWSCLTLLTLALNLGKFTSAPPPHFLPYLFTHSKCLFNNPERAIKLPGFKCLLNTLSVLLQLRMFATKRSFWGLQREVRNVLLAPTDLAPPLSTFQTCSKQLGSWILLRVPKTELMDGERIKPVRSPSNEQHRVTVPCVVCEHIWLWLVDLRQGQCWWQSSCFCTSLQTQWVTLKFDLWT